MIYAITFDIDTEILSNSYPNDSWRNAYNEIKQTLQNFGFEWQQGSVYFGNDKVNPVTCFLAVTALTKNHNWFASSVKDIRMLRIEEQNDLEPVIQEALK